MRISFALLLLGAVGLAPFIAPLAQHGRDVPVNVTSIGTRRTAQGAVITLSADAPLNRTQTWQDAEGFHVTLPYAGQSPVKGGAGVKVRRIGNSLEVVVPVRAGASVMVQPRFNRLDLIVNGDAELTNNDNNDKQAATSSRRASRQSEADSAAALTERLPRAPRERRTQTTAPLAPAATSKTNVVNNSSSPPITSGAPNASRADAAPQTTAQANNASIAPPPTVAVPATPATNTVTDSATTQTNTETPDDGGLFSFLFSTPGIVFLVVVLGLVTFMVLWYRKNAGFEDVENEETASLAALATTKVVVDDTPAGEQRTSERRKKRRRSTDEVADTAAVNSSKALSTAPQRDSTSAANAVQTHTATELFGAYRGRSGSRQIAFRPAASHGCAGVACAG